MSQVQLELSTLQAAGAASIGAVAERVERDGWHGLAVVDSQNLSGDAYVALAVAAGHSDRLRLSTAVTNPVTRHPAVTASAIASIDRLSDGRAVLGIGRGDSSLAHLGRAPAPVGVLERYVDVLQRYLRGEEVPFDALGFHEAIAPEVDALGLADTPSGSRLLGLDRARPKVEVEVAATGPKVIAAAARTADRVLLALGADPERLAWGMETAREARRAAGLDPDGISFGAYLNIAPHPERATARALVSGGLTTFARFAVMHGRVAGPVSDEQRRVLEALKDRYDMTQHTRVGSPQASVLTDEFIDRYAVVGSADEVRTRLEALAGLGLERVVVIAATSGADRAAARRAGEIMAAEVLPAFSR